MLDSTRKVVKGNTLPTCFAKWYFVMEVFYDMDYRKVCFIVEELALPSASFHL